MKPRTRGEPAAAVCFVAATFMTIMDSTVVTVALPTLAREFHASGSAVGAVSVAYLVSLAVCIPVSGWLGDRYGTKRTFLAALALFTVASALCGLADGLAPLVAARVVQGAGGGLLVPTGTAMLYRAYPPEERVRVARLLQAPTALAPALGPLLGGLLITRLSWHWVFYVNVPVGLAVLVYGLRSLTEHREDRPGRFDIAGFWLAGSGLGLLMYALAQGPSAGWASATVAGAGGAGAALLVAFILVERRVRMPMIPFSLFRDRLFRSVSLAFLLGQCSFLGALYLAPMFLQNARGASVLSSGLTTFYEALGITAATQIAARVYRTVGPRRTMAAGLLGTAAVLVVAATVDEHTPAWRFAVLMFALGFSMGHVWLPAQAAAFATISGPSIGRAATVFSTQRQLGAALGTAAMGAVLAAGSADGAPPSGVGAYHAGFLTAAGFALVGALAALAVPDRDAASTMRPKPAGEAAARDPDPTPPRSDHQ